MKLIKDTEFLVIDFETITPKGRILEPIEVGTLKIKENNIDNIFKILKFNEKLFINDEFVEKLKDLDSYKIIINDDVLTYMFKR